MTRSLLAEHLAALGATLASREGRIVAASFGDPQREAAAARAAAVLADWSFRGKVLLTGADRVALLHGQCTQDVRGTPVGGGGYAFILDPRGRVVCDLRFMVDETRLFLEVHPEAVHEASRWLERFIIASDVHLHGLTEDFGALRVAGPQAGALLRALFDRPLPEEEGSWIAAGWRGETIMAQADRELGLPGAIVWAPEAAVLALHEELRRIGADHGIVLAGYDALDVLRTEAGRPWWGRELDAQVLPAESGQLERAVSFTKGCYTGQEVVAKQHYLGRPRKVLTGLFVEGDAGEGDLVRADGQELGRLTTVHRSPALERTIALAVLKGGEHAPGRRLEAVAPDGTARGALTAAALPFVAAS